MCTYVCITIRTYIYLLTLIITFFYNCAIVIDILLIICDVIVIIRESSFNAYCTQAFIVLMGWAHQEKSSNEVYFLCDVNHIMAL